MATYPLTPTSLATLDETTPTGLEDASKLDDAILQTRKIFKAVMQVQHNDDGTHKNIGTTGLADAAVTGAKMGAGAQGVLTANINDKAVTDTKLANDAAVDANRAVGTNHVKDLAITTPKIGANAVTGAKIGTGANGVDTANLKDAAVTLAKLGVDVTASISAGVTNGAVTPVKISNIGLAKLLVGDGAAAQAGEVGGVLTAVWNDVTKKLEFSFAPSAIPVAVAVIVEQGADGGTAAGGNCAANAWTSRPAAGSTALSIQDDPLNLFALVAPASGTARLLKFKKAGTYQVHMHVSAYNGTGASITMCGRLVTVTDITTLTLGTTLLTTDLAPVAAGFIARLDGFDVFTVDTDNTLVAIQQYSTAAAVNGMGNGTIAVAGLAYKFMQLMIVKIG